MVVTLYEELADLDAWFTEAMRVAEESAIEVGNSTMDTARKRLEKFKVSLLEIKKELLCNNLIFPLSIQSSRKERVLHHHLSITRPIIIPPLHLSSSLLYTSELSRSIIHFLPNILIIFFLHFRTFLKALSPRRTPLIALLRMSKSSKAIDKTVLLSKYAM